MTKDEFKKAMKPIIDGMLGKQRKPVYEKPHYQIRDLNDMMADLVAVPGQDWYRYAFSRDPLNGKLNDEQRRIWTQKAISCGYEYADKAAAEYGSRDPSVIAQKMGMEVTTPNLPNKTDRVLFADFTPPNHIRIYMDAVRKAEDLLRDPETADLMTSRLQVSDILLSHELFHVIEERHKKEIYTRTEKVRLWHIGTLHNDSVLIANSEIAAMAFAQRLNDLPYFPYVLDVFLVYGYSPEEASGLYEEMMEYVKDSHAAEAIESRELIGNDDLKDTEGQQKEPPAEGTDQGTAKIRKEE